MTVACQTPEAAYIHVPFCAHKCGYCDFTVIAGKDHLADDFLRALSMELATLESARRVRTLFVGGGTPTHLAADKLTELLSLLSRWFELEDGGEFSVEANPSSLDRDKIALLAEHGVNRVSLGVQSFDARVLKLLERDHDAAQVAVAVEALESAIPNFSCDLIFGVPGQTLALWRETLARAVSLGPRHVSTYGLTYEKGTAFWARRADGTLRPVSDEIERRMYAAAMDDLPAAGYEQYELSNFARPGYRCRHNEVYWAGCAYYGFGPGAARYLDGRRETNHRSVLSWMRQVLARQSPVGEVDELPAVDRARETLVVMLRRTRGVGRDEFRATTGFDFEEIAGPAIDKHCALGLLERDLDGVRLTREGRFLADSVIVDLV